MQARGFFSAPAWFSSAIPAVEHGNTTGAGAKKDSYEEVKHLPDTPEPVREGFITGKLDIRCLDCNSSFQTVVVDDDGNSISLS